MARHATVPNYNREKFPISVPIRHKSQPTCSLCKKLMHKKVALAGTLQRYTLERYAHIHCIRLAEEERKAAETVAKPKRKRAPRKKVVVEE